MWGLLCRDAPNLASFATFCGARFPGPQFVRSSYGSRLEIRRGKGLGVAKGYTPMLNKLQGLLFQILPLPQF